MASAFAGFRRVKASGVALLLTVATTLTAGAAQPFYQDKTLTIVVGSAAGSVYDAYSRILAVYLPKYLPGVPSVVVQDMPGAGGVTAAYYLLHTAPRDGTMIGAAISTIPTAPLVHPEMATYDPNAFSWIGSMSRDIFIGYAWHDAPVRTFAAAKQKQMILGSLAFGNISFDLPVVSNALLGTKFKLITGYDDQSAVRLALERGEIQGAMGAGYSSVKTSDADWLREGKIDIFVQFGFRKQPELANVPMFLDQAKTTEERQALRLMLAGQDFQKPYFAPPGVPSERLLLLRRAFDKALKDPKLLSDAARAHLQVLDPMTGEELAARVEQLSKTPPRVIERVRGVLADFIGK